VTRRNPIACIAIVRTVLIRITLATCTAAQVALAHIIVAIARQSVIACRACQKGMNTALTRNAGVGRAHVVIPALEKIGALTDPLSTMIPDRAVVAVFTKRIDELRGAPKRLKAGIRRAGIPIVTILQRLPNTLTHHTVIHLRTRIPIITGRTLLNRDMLATPRDVAFVESAFVSIITGVHLSRQTRPFGADIPVGAGVSIIASARIAGRKAPQRIRALIGGAQIPIGAIDARMLTAAEFLTGILRAGTPIVAIFRNMHTAKGTTGVDRAGVLILTFHR
jgi:hypothetical protein